MGQQQTKAESYSQATKVLTNDQLLIIKKQFSHLVRGFALGGERTKAPGFVSFATTDGDAG